MSAGLSSAVGPAVDTDDKDEFEDFAESSWVFASESFEGNLREILDSVDMLSLFLGATSGVTES